MELRENYLCQIQYNVQIETNDSVKFRSMLFNDIQYVYKVQRAVK